MNFIESCSAGDVKTVIELLKKPIAFSAKTYNAAFQAAVDNGHVSVVDLLLHDGRFIPFASQNSDEYSAMRNAIRNGDLQMLDRLLQDTRIDPAADQNFAILFAVEKRNLPIIERLLQDKRVDPERGLVWPVDIFVVNRLLDDKRVDPSANQNYALRCAALKGNIAVVNRLLQDSRVNPSACGDFALIWAARNGHVAVVDRLLQDDRIDPSVDNYRPITWAAQYMQFDVVDRLLDDRRSPFSAVLLACPKEKLVYFEYRERFTEISIALQNLNLPAWITMLILKASYPWTLLEIHKRWTLVCTVKHFHNCPGAAE